MSTMSMRGHVLSGMPIDNDDGAEVDLVACAGADVDAFHSWSGTSSVLGTSIMAEPRVGLQPSLNL